MENLSKYSKRVNFKFYFLLTLTIFLYYLINFFKLFSLLVTKYYKWLKVYHSWDETKSLCFLILCSKISIFIFGSVKFLLNICSYLSCMMFSSFKILQYNRCLFKIFAPHWQSLLSFFPCKTDDRTYQHLVSLQTMQDTSVILIPSTITFF